MVRPKKVGSSLAKRAAGLIKYNPQTLYKVVNRATCLFRIGLIVKVFERRFQPFCHDIEEQFAFHPVVIQRILQGRIGEEGIRALLSDKQLATNKTSTTMSCLNYMILR